MSEDAAEGWRARAEAAEARATALAEERARLWEELHRLRAERREVDYYAARMRQMEGSVSWRLTSPLRSSKALAGKLRRKLEQRRAA